LLPSTPGSPPLVPPLLHPAHSASAAAPSSFVIRVMWFLRWLPRQIARV